MDVSGGPRLPGQSTSRRLLDAPSRLSSAVYLLAVRRGVCSTPLAGSSGLPCLLVRHRDADLAPADLDSHQRLRDSQRLEPIRQQRVLGSTG